jgi:hypothetical protein
MRLSAPEGLDSEVKSLQMIDAFEAKMVSQWQIFGSVKLLFVNAH